MMTEPAVFSRPDTTTPLAPLRERLSWALYDFANTVFSMNIATLYFSAWLVADLGRSNTLYALVNGIASALVVVSIPVFGAISDLTQRRKPWVVAFTIISCASLVVMAVLGQTGLPLVGEGVIDPGPARSAISPGLALFGVLAAFTLANYTYQGAMPFYNAMLSDLTPVDYRGRLSGLGTGLGYVGTIVGVLLTLPFFTGVIPLIGPLPSHVVDFLRDFVPFTSHGGRVSTFVPTALLFLLFSLPLFFFCRDHNATRGRKVELRKAFADVADTVRDARGYPGTLRFLLTSFLYQDAMGTMVANMALYAIFAMGFTKGSEATLLLVLTIPAIFGSYAIGKLVDRFGPKRVLSWVLASWIFLLLAMIGAPTRMSFWIVGAAIGLIFGGIATAERPLLLTLVPAAEGGRFFSLMVLSARAAAIVGPFIWAFTVDGLTPAIGVGSAYRAGVVTVAIGMALAWWGLRGVPDNFRKSAVPGPQ